MEKNMSIKISPGYLLLEIQATSPSVEIWVGDGKGYLVAKSTGLFQEGLLPGFYVVEFGLGSNVYPIDLTENTQLTQAEIESGPTCLRNSGKE